MDKVFVTGSTGFIGTQLVAKLVQRGFAVRALVRKPMESTSEIEYVQGDIADVESIRRGMDGCRYAFHLAAYARNWSRDPGVYDRLNVQATEDVFTMARNLGVERIVWTSSVVTLGPTRPGTVGDESMPRATEKFFTAYERTKTEMERRSAHWVAEGLPLVIANPTRVYGPGLYSEANSVSKLIDEYRRGRLPVLFNFGKNIGNYALVDDVAEGHILALERGRPGERYILGGENASLKELFRTVDRVDGKKRLQIPIAWFMPLVLSNGMLAAANLFGVYPTFTPGWIRTFLVDWAYSSRKAEEELGYRITPFEEGVQRTCRWLSELTR